MWGPNPGGKEKERKIVCAWSRPRLTFLLCLVQIIGLLWFGRWGRWDGQFGEWGGREGGGRKCHVKGSVCKWEAGYKRVQADVVIVCSNLHHVWHSDKTRYTHKRALEWTSFPVQHNYTIIVSVNTTLTSSLNKLDKHKCPCVQFKQLWKSVVSL